MEAAKEDPSVLLSFLDDCLGAVAGAGAPAQLVSPSAFTLLRKVAMLVAQAYLEATGGESSTNAKPHKCTHRGCLSLRACGHQGTVLDILHGEGKHELSQQA